jgi:hypothetical protein
MKAYSFSLIILLIFCACSEPNSKKKSSRSNASAAKEVSEVTYASKEAHDFFNWWFKTYGKPVHMNDQFRAKLFYKRDVVELFKYLKRNGVKESVFKGLQDTIDALSYRRFNPAWIQSKDVMWIDQDRLRSCRKISKDAMWDCLESDYGITNYYYVSRPLFSLDNKWAVVSINYMQKDGNASNGANRLFKRKAKDAWEEVAILTFWGNFKSE